MGLKYTQELKEALSALQSPATGSLSEVQQEILRHANQIIKQLEQESNKKETDWNTIFQLGMQAASLLFEMFKSD